MATPSSSATSASPPMASLQPHSVAPTADSAGMEPIERERRKNAVQKFLARAENSMVRVLAIPLFGVNARVLLGMGLMGRDFIRLPPYARALPQALFFHARSVLISLSSGR